MSVKPDIMVWAQSGDESHPDVIIRNGEVIAAADRAHREDAVLFVNEVAANGHRSDVSGGGWVSTRRTGLLSWTRRRIAAEVPVLDPGVESGKNAIILGMILEGGRHVQEVEVAAALTVAAEQAGWEISPTTMGAVSRQVQLASRRGCL